MENGIVKGHKVITSEEDALKESQLWYVHRNNDTVVSAKNQNLALQVNPDNELTLEMLQPGLKTQQFKLVTIEITILAK